MFLTQLRGAGNIAWKRAHVELIRDSRVMQVRKGPRSHSQVNGLLYMMLLSPQQVSDKIQNLKSLSQPGNCFSSFGIGPTSPALNQNDRASKLAQVLYAFVKMSFARRRPGMSNFCPKHIFIVKLYYKCHLIYPVMSGLH